MRNLFSFELLEKRGTYIPITLILFIGVYFLIEIQSRYRYELYPYFILLAGFGMREFFKLFKLKNLTNQDLN